MRHLRPRDAGIDVTVTGRASRRSGVSTSPLTLLNHTPMPGFVPFGTSSPRKRAISDAARRNYDNFLNPAANYVPAGGYYNSPRMVPLPMSPHGQPGGYLPGHPPGPYPQYGWPSPHFYPQEMQPSPSTYPEMNTFIGY